MWFKRLFAGSKRKARTLSTPFSGKIEVFARHCSFSDISAHKQRFVGFSREKCHTNFLRTIDFEQVNITYFLDTAKGARSDHFLKNASSLIEIQEGTEAGAFLQLLDFISAQSYHPETILYIVEDDYLHRPGWIDILLEGFCIPNVDYVTLYDHRDKYFLPMYEKLSSQLFLTPSTHWRSVPSTTHTFATKFKTLQEDLKIHRRYSRNRKISADHEKFCALQKKGRLLVSPIPGFSTHAEPEFASPTIDWSGFFV